MGIGDWGLGMGDCGFGPMLNSTFAMPSSGLDNEEKIAESLKKDQQN